MSITASISTQQKPAAAAASALPVQEPLLNDVDKESLQRLPIQRKLSIGSPDDPLEHEADAVADKVMRMPEQSFMQRKCAECEEEDKLQRKAYTSAITPYIQAKGNGASDSVTQKISSTKGRGSGMDSGTTSFMESRFGTDFSAVKIHTGDYAVQMSKELNAQAFTTGSDVYFNSGKYNPNSDAGKHLLAHELTHTIQQNNNVTRKLIQKNGSPPAAPVYGAVCTGGTTDPCQYSRCDGRHDGINNDFRKAIDYTIAAYGALGASTLSERTTQALDWYFNDHSASTVSTVRERMLCIALCLMDAYGHNQYGCLPSYDNAIAYVCVGSTPVCTDSVTNVCLTDSYFGKSDRVRAEVLIHECGHRIGLSLGGPDFDIYDFRWHFLSLNTSEALMNTDSFALFTSSITEGIRVTTLLPVYPVGGSFSAGTASRSGAGTSTWFARYYGGAEFQHPALGIFSPTIGIGLTLIGEPQSAVPGVPTPFPTFIASLLPGFRLSDPRPGEAGSGYASFWGGPSINIGPSSIVRPGVEAGMGVGYRWRWLDVSLNAGYNYDPTHLPGLEHVFTFGPAISFSPFFTSTPGSH